MFYSMVLEALSAIGLAGNIVQFVHFTWELISKSQEIYHSTSGLSAEHLELKVVSQSLQRLATQLEVYHGQKSSLGILAKQCKDVANELLSAIQKLQGDDPRGHPEKSKKWKSFRHALKCVWKMDHIVKLQSRLERLRNEIMLQLVSETR